MLIIKIDSIFVLLNTKKKKQFSFSASTSSCPTNRCRRTSNKTISIRESRHLVRRWSMNFNRDNLYLFVLKSVYRNGDPLTLPVKVLLVKSTLPNWENVLDEISRKVLLNNTAVLKYEREWIRKREAFLIEIDFFQTFCNEWRIDKLISTTWI